MSRLRLRLAGLSLAVAAALSLSAVRAADVKLLPNDTEIVLTINVQQILQSDLVKTNKDALEQLKGLVEQGLQADNQAQKFLKETGFDLFKDLHSLTFAMPPSKDPEAGFILIEGNFNVEKVHAVAEAAAKENGETFKITKAGAHKILEIAAPTGQKVHACLATKSLMVVAPSDASLKDALERLAGTKKSELKKEFTALLQTVNDKQSISFAVTGAAIKKLIEDNPNVPNAEMVAQLMGKVEGLSGAVTIAKDIQVQLGVGTKDAASAKEFANSANVALGFVKLMAMQAAKQDEKVQPLADAAKSLQATANGSNLVIRANISAENLEKLFKNFMPQ